MMTYFWPWEEERQWLTRCWWWTASRFPPRLVLSRSFIMRNLLNGHSQIVTLTNKKRIFRLHLYIAYNLADNITRIGCDQVSLLRIQISSEHPLCVRSICPPITAFCQYRYALPDLRWGKIWHKLDRTTYICEMNPIGDLLIRQLINRRRVAHSWGTKSIRKVWGQQQDSYFERWLWQHENYSGLSLWNTWTEVMEQHTGSVRPGLNLALRLSAKDERTHIKIARLKYRICYLLIYQPIGGEVLNKSDP